MTDEQQQQVRTILERLANMATDDLTIHISKGRVICCPFCTMPNHVTHANDCPVVQARLLIKHI